jgi:hypothetical protein
MILESLFVVFVLNLFSLYYIASWLNGTLEQFVLNHPWLVERARRVHPNFDQQELVLYCRRWSRLGGLLALFPPWLLSLVGSRLRNYFCQQTRQWILEVAHRQLIFKTLPAAFDRLKQIKPESLERSVYLIFNCGHTVSWSELDQPLSTESLRRAAFRKIGQERCRYCFSSIDHFVVIRREILIRLINLSRQPVLEECPLTGHPLTRHSAIGLLPCGHYASYQSMMKWFPKKRRCPYCNQTTPELYFNRPWDSSRLLRAPTKEWQEEMPFFDPSQFFDFLS